MPPCVLSTAGWLIIVSHFQERLLQGEQIAAPKPFSGKWVILHKEIRFLQPGATCQNQQPTFLIWQFQRSKCCPNKTSPLLQRNRLEERKLYEHWPECKAVCKIATVCFPAKLFKTSRLFTENLKQNICQTSEQTLSPKWILQTLVNLPFLSGRWAGKEWTRPVKPTMSEIERQLAEYLKRVALQPVNNSQKSVAPRP